ncbi:hypothetical protein [Segetibacter sp. 3557_3]|uniref:hypothetical protein n=1 Tax=Segetibacter sp. 3557_3 TaxID=2547429 RepID=UPI0014046D9B|nr:hypothetical protein [Segetibacter sp. 3557_3]
MNQFPDPKKDEQKKEENAVKPTEEKQQQSDPNLTELKGLVDPKEDLEVKGTDNPF